MNLFILILFITYNTSAVTTISTPYPSLEQCQTAGKDANLSSGKWLEFACVPAPKVL